MTDEETCAVGPCQEKRFGGREYCFKHGPQPTARGAAGGDRQIVCPHCGVRGKVTTKASKVKRGVSGGKATGAVLTAGFSLLATGLSRKVKVTEATCRNCGVHWTIS